MITPDRAMAARNSSTDWRRTGILPAVTLFSCQSPMGTVDCREDISTAAL